MFEKIISVDWSGASSETAGVDLRVATYETVSKKCHLLGRPFTNRHIASWTRESFRKWIIDQIQPQSPRALVAIDFGFGLPWNADRAIFNVEGWRQLVALIATRYRQSKTARAAAAEINELHQAIGGVPYRFNDSRNAFSFYVAHGVSYYRLTELCAPQAISQWYLGSGGTVGFHTISGLAMLDHLLSLREQKKLDFFVWPHDGLVLPEDKHVFVESYPSLAPGLNDYGPCTDGNQQDAWKVLDMLVNSLNNNSLADLFNIPVIPFGRYDNLAFEEQIQFEGWIFGIVGK